MIFAAGMPGWFTEFLGIARMFSGADMVWKFCMTLVFLLMGQTPSSMSPEAWNYVTGTVYPWFTTIGVTLLNLFFMAGFIRQSTNLRENMSMEVFVEQVIKVIIANILIVSAVPLIQNFISGAGLLSQDILSAGYPEIFSAEVDAGAVIAYVLFGLIYIILSALCGIIILVEVLGRFLNLFLLTAFAPVAFSTLAGGRGIENTAFAWIKSFLTSVFQIVVIALIIRIGSLMITGGAFGSMETSGAESWFDGFGDVLFSMITMVFMATAVKGADAFLKRALDLR
ncbi:MAG: hypothetical protein J5973_08200 [Eubacterium sp.]|nr:hypothetical protein [Eubacterium sp.]